MLGQQERKHFLILKKEIIQPALKSPHLSVGEQGEIPRREYGENWFLWSLETDCCSELDLEVMKRHSGGTL